MKLWWLRCSSKVDEVFLQKHAVWCLQMSCHHLLYCCFLGKIWNYVTYSHMHLPLISYSAFRILETWKIGVWRNHERELQILRFARHILASCWDACGTKQEKIPRTVKIHMNTVESLNKSNLMFILSKYFNMQKRNITISIILF